MPISRNKTHHPKPSNIIGQRLKFEMKSRGVSSAELSKRADVKTSFIYDIISGKSSNPSTVKLARVAEGLGITLVSLLNQQSMPSQAKAGAKPQSNDYIAIPYLTMDDDKENTQASNKEDQPFCFLASWIARHLRIAAADLRVFVMSGDSMEPTLCHNDVVLVDTVNKNPTQPGVFVLYDGYGLVVKRIERVMSSPTPRIRILSDNPQYSIYEKLPAEAGIVGRVVWFSRSI